MSERKVRLHPEADAEATATYRWYQERSLYAARSFGLQLELAINKIKTLLSHGLNSTQGFVVSVYPGFHI